MLNLDTHILLYALKGDISRSEEKKLRNNTWSISTIVLWEITKLHQLKRINISLDDSDLSHVLRQLHIWPIDVDVCRCISELDFKSDSADEIIAATSLCHGIPLLTRDQKILKSKKVPFI